MPKVALVSGHEDFRMQSRYTHMKAETLRLEDQLKNNSSNLLVSNILTTFTYFF